MDGHVHSFRFSAEVFQQIDFAKAVHVSASEPDRRPSAIAVANIGYHVDLCVPPRLHGNQARGCILRFKSRLSPIDCALPVRRIRNALVSSDESKAIRGDRKIGRRAAGIILCRKDIAGNARMRSVQGFGGAPTKCSIDPRC